jgi:hypothetical protein
MGRSVESQRPSPRTAPCGWCCTDYTAEGTREVLLVAHTVVYRNRVQGLGCRQHPRLGHLNTPPQHIVARRCAKRTFERTTKVAGAQAHEPRELPCTLLDILPSTWAIILHICQAARPPRGTWVSTLNSRWAPREPRLGMSRRSATACATRALVASPSPPRDLHAASISWAATTVSSCAKARVAYPSVGGRCGGHASFAQLAS